MPPLHDRIKGITQNIISQVLPSLFKPSFTLAVYSYLELMSNQDLCIRSHLISQIIIEVHKRMGEIGNFF